MHKNVHSTLIVIALPVHKLADLITWEKQQFKRHHKRFVIGTVFMIVGSSTAIVSGHFHMPLPAHICVDMVAYEIHGCGVTPFLLWVVKRFDLEGKGEHEDHEG